MMKNSFQSYALGATLYMPILHPKVPEILAEKAVPRGTSIVLCLEDALAENDVERGLATLRSLLESDSGPFREGIFIRPRSLDMALQLARYDGLNKIEGFVAPKVVPETASTWMSMAETAGIKIMPTLESAEFYDPSRVRALRDALDDTDRSHIAAIRLGGNDLLGAMSLRRQSGITSWEGPLGWILSMASSMLISAGYPVSAPVFDIISDIETLRREVAQDVASGFVSKTAIHPAQVPHIIEAFQPCSSELAQADAILHNGAAAVFQIGGAMCEPSTHRGWAQRIQARADIFGMRESSDARVRSAVRA